MLQLVVLLLMKYFSTEAELTPIVVSQLQSTKKHKDELRKARRGSQPASQPKTETPAASGRNILQPTRF